MRVTDLMFCRKAHARGGGWENSPNVPNCVKFATWNTGTMTGLGKQKKKFRPIQKDVQFRNKWQRRIKGATG